MMKKTIALLLSFLLLITSVSIPAYATAEEGDSNLYDVFDVSDETKNEIVETYGLTENPMIYKIYQISNLDSYWEAPIAETVETLIAESPIDYFFRDSTGALGWYLNPDTDYYKSPGFEYFHIGYELLLEAINNGERMLQHMFDYKLQILDLYVFKCSETYINEVYIYYKTDQGGFVYVNGLHGDATYPLVYLMPEEVYNQAVQARKDEILKHQSEMLFGTVLFYQAYDVEDYRICGEAQDQLSCVHFEDFLPYLIIAAGCVVVAVGVAFTIYFLCKKKKCATTE